MTFKLPVNASHDNTSRWRSKILGQVTFVVFTQLWWIPDLTKTENVLLLVPCAVPQFCGPVILWCRFRNSLKPILVERPLFYCKSIIGTRKTVYSCERWRD